MAFVWDDVRLNEERPFVLVRGETTKNRDKRAIPLHPSLVPVLRAKRAEIEDTATKVSEVSDSSHAVARLGAGGNRAQGRAWPCPTSALVP